MATYQLARSFLGCQLHRHHSQPAPDTSESLIEVQVEPQSLPTVCTASWYAPYLAFTGNIGRLHKKTAQQAELSAAANQLLHCQA
jgi:hypothetical protein